MYTSPTPTYDDQNYGRAPRTSYGRRAPLMAPYTTVRRTSGPLGDTTSTTDRIPVTAQDPGQQIGNATVNMGSPSIVKPVQMSLDHALMLQNMGNITRGPSGPGHNTALYGPGGFGSSPMTGSAPGYQPTAAGNTSATPGVTPGATATPAGRSPLEEKRLQQEYRKFRGYIADHEKSMGDPNDANYQFWQKRTGEIRGILGASPGASAAPTAPGATPPMSSPTPTATASPTAPSMTQQPAPQAPLSEEERQRRLTATRQSTSNFLDQNPNFGVQDVPAEKTQLNYTDKAAANAVEAGPEVTARNAAATLRMGNAGRQGVIDKNKAQLADNQRISQMLGQQQATADAQRTPKNPSAPGVATDTATGQPTATQPSQPVQVTSAEQHAALPIGAAFIWNGKQYIKGQQGQ